jgi:hypothetical protein
MARSGSVVLRLLGLCGAVGALEHSTRRRIFAAALVSALPTAALAASPAAAADAATQFERVSPLQFIAALGDGKASSGSGAQDWGLWRKDPGPRGVRLAGCVPTATASRPSATRRNRSQRLAKAGKADAGWTFDAKDWWLEEHGASKPPRARPVGRAPFASHGLLRQA